MTRKKRSRGRLTLSTWLRLPEREAFKNLEQLTLRLANQVLQEFWLLSSGGGSQERLAAYTAAEFPRSRSRGERGAARIASAADRFGTILVKNLPAAAGDTG